MQNILFVLYFDFRANSAVHVHHFANSLVAQGLNCVVAVPHSKETISVLGKHLYKTMEFDEIHQIKDVFPDGRGPDIVHAWTPREVVRLYYERLQELYNFKLFIHLEDNEEHILEKFLQTSYKDLCNNCPDSIPLHLSHPLEYHKFLEAADGVTVIIERLKEFVPDYTPTLVLYPGADIDCFFPRARNPELALELGIPLNSAVLCYTGNVHPANAHEVRSLYLATAMLNREGYPTMLVRTGQGTANILGEDDRWAQRYSIELGFVDRDRLPDILALADVLVQPGRSGAFNDYRFPSKLPEFLAMGKPVILPAANLGLLMENKKDALILPVADALSIVEAVKLLLNNKELYDKLSSGSVNFAKKYLSWSKSSENLKAFYETVFRSEKTTTGIVRTQIG